MPDQLVSFWIHFGVFSKASWDYLGGIFKPNSVLIRVPKIQMELNNLAIYIYTYIYVYVRIIFSFCMYEMHITHIIKACCTKYMNVRELHRCVLMSVGVC